jgi:signal transduction histidine kinase
VKLRLIEYQKDIKRRNSCDDIEELESEDSEENLFQNLPRITTATPAYHKQISIDEKLAKSSVSNTVEEFVKYSLSIEDSGVGIAEENLDKLFVNFGKLGEHDHMNAVGTGLGLSICK